MPNPDEEFKARLKHMWDDHIASERCRCPACQDGLLRLANKLGLAGVSIEGVSLDEATVKPDKEAEK
jgi:hypothetical protein